MEMKILNSENVRTIPRLPKEGGDHRHPGVSLSATISLTITHTLLFFFVEPRQMFKSLARVETRGEILRHILLITLVYINLFNSLSI